MKDKAKNLIKNSLSKKKKRKNNQEKPCLNNSSLENLLKEKFPKMLQNGKFIYLLIVWEYLCFKRKLTVIQGK